MASLEERVSRIEGAYEQMTERMNDLVIEIRELRQEMRQEIGDLRKVMENRTWWLVALILTTWVATISTILIKG